MSLTIGTERLYPGSKNSGSRMIKTKVELFGRKSDSFSTSSSSRSKKFNDPQRTYKDLKGSK